MTRTPLLVASDLDGTLLRSDGTVSARTVAAVAAIQRVGIRFVVATARPPRWLHDLLHVVGEHGLAICSNGAFTYDVAGRRVLSERTLSANTAREIVLLLRAEIPGVSFAVENRFGFGLEPSYIVDHEAPVHSPVADVLDLLAPAPGKLLARAPGMAPGAFIDAATRVIGDRAVLAYSGAVGLAEISARGVTKAAVLADWAASWGVDAADVCAFGDMPNDLAMLSWAGASYAVTNAHPAVRAAATYTCRGNDDDGVARILETFATAAAGRPPVPTGAGSDGLAERTGLRD